MVERHVADVLSENQTEEETEVERKGRQSGKYIKKVPCKRSEPSTRLSHEPCFGVKVNSKRPAGWAASQALVSLEMCAE